jgi:hypothetical protein
MASASRACLSSPGRGGKRSSGATVGSISGGGLHAPWPSYWLWEAMGTMPGKWGCNGATSSFYKRSPSADISGRGFATSGPRWSSSSDGGGASSKAIRKPNTTFQKIKRVAPNAACHAACGRTLTCRVRVNPILFAILRPQHFPGRLIDEVQLGAR